MAPPQAGLFSGDMQSLDDLNTPPFDRDVAVLGLGGGPGTKS